jgi:hypothetical protein
MDQKSVLLGCLDSRVRARGETISDDPSRGLPAIPKIAERAQIGSMEEYERLYRLSLDEPERFRIDTTFRIAAFEPHGYLK